LQRALEAPVNMGREFLQVLPYFKHPVELEDIGKKAVIAKFREIFGHTDLISAFNYLQSKDQNYTQFLENTLKGIVSRKQYEDYIGILAKTCFPVAINWAKDMRSVHRSLLDGSFKMPEGNITQFRGKESLG
jgi:hypothetical protein